MSDSATSPPARLAASLPIPFFIGHRGMANVFPENTLEAYRGAVALGVDVVETDCWLTRDGGLVCLHDDTLDRTTSGSGSSHELTTPGAAILEVDAGRWFAAAWPTALRVPSFTDVLDELGDGTVLCPEAKNSGAGQGIVDRLARYHLLDAAIVQSFARAELTAAIAAGTPTMMLMATSSYDPIRLHAAGIQYLGLSAALQPSLVPPARAAGMDVVVWVVDRRADAAPWLAAGAVGLFSNDPLYVSGRSPVLTSDPFGQRTYYHGHLANAVCGDRGTFSSAGAWGYADTTPAYKGALQGWASPINRADRFRLAFTVCMDGAASSQGFAGAFVCAADDRSFDDLDQHRPGTYGYHALIRMSGRLELHVVNDGIAHPAASTETSAIASGGTASLLIDVSPTHIAVTRTDIASPITVSVAHAIHRGGYFHLGRRAAAVRFFDVTIT